MEQGWIKLHRKILENPIIQKPNYLALWIILLLKANHQDKKFMWNGNIILVKEGQMITGRKELSRETSIPESTIEDILKFLERQHQIQQQKTTKYRIITIVNWVKHQDKNSKSDNKATTKQQQTDTNKNEKNEKNNIVASDTPFSLKEEIKKLEDSNRRDLNIIALYFDYRKPDLKNREQYEIALKRHLKPAGLLKNFTDGQIIKAIDYAKKEYKDIYTLETLIKILVK